jgi:DNA-binding transcriptional LysR family regulator
MTSIPSTPNLLAFEAVARRRSFALAAAELNLTASAVSHQIARLEDQLGVRLFERNAHGVRLSADGERYLSRVGGAIAALVAATGDLRQGLVDSLYLHCSPSLASLWLMPRLGDFAKRHPDISLNLSASHAPSDFAHGQADLDIRYGVPEWPGLEVEPLFEELIAPLASPAFIREHRLKHPDALHQVPLIQSTVNVVQWPDWFARFSERHLPERVAMRFDRAQLALDAAVQGLGVALESSKMAARHLADRRLRPVFDAGFAISVQAHFLVYPARHAARKPVAAFLDWLREVVRRDP